MSENHLTAPSTVFWDVTHSCNLKCIHCYAGAGEKSSNELNTEEAENLIDEFVSMKIFEISISGGEPLLRKDLFSLIDYATSNNLNVSLSTNGTLISDKEARKMRNLDMRVVQVSLDGATAGTHDCFRGVKGSFDKALYAIRLLSKEGVNVSVATVVTHYNLQELERIAEIASSLGAHGLHVLRFNPIGRGSEKRDLLMNLGDYLFLIKKISEIHRRFKNRLFIQPDEAFRIELDQRRNSLLKISGCQAGRTLCGISPEGYVTPCALFNERNMIEKLKPDSIRKVNFRKIWERSNLLNKFRTMSIPVDCIDCRFQNECKGGCKAAAFSYHGDLSSSDPICLVKLEETQGLNLGFSNLKCR